MERKGQKDTLWENQRKVFAHQKAKNEFEQNWSNGTWA